MGLDAKIYIRRHEGNSMVPWERDGSTVEALEDGSMDGSMDDGFGSGAFVVDGSTGTSISTSFGSRLLGFHSNPC